jgi:hypothetical protein
MGDERNKRKVLVEKPETKEPLGIFRRGLEDNIKVDLREPGWCVRTGLIWLMMRTSRGLLWTWYWTFGIQKMLKNC